MTRSFAILLTCTGFVYVFCSNNSGVGFAGAKDRTGGPFSAGLTCGQCHNSSAMATPNTTIEISDVNQNPVNSYQPDEIYNIKFKVNSTSAASYGFQAVALKEIDNSQAGSFIVAGSNTRVTTMGPRQYPEQSSRSTSGEFLFTWTAPSEGSGNVKFYICGNAVNNSNSAAGDKSSTLVFTLPEQTIANSPEIIENLPIILFPNPVIDYISLKNFNFNQANYSIFDLSGKCIQPETACTTIIPVNYLATGTYIVLIRTLEKNYSFTFNKL